jgi:hypothetical protein
MAFDYTSLALKRLASQFVESPKLRALLAHIIGPLEVVEGEVDNIRNKRWIDTAVGAQLDGLGTIVGEGLEGRNDDDYREALRFRVFINVSKGTPPDVIRALDYITKADDVQYMESWPATVYLYSNGYSANKLLPDVMQDLLPTAISDVDVAVSFGEEALRVSNPSQITDDESELAGLAASVLHCLDGRRLRTLSGKRIRIRTGYVIHKTKPTLTGLFEKK